MSPRGLLQGFLPGITEIVTDFKSKTPIPAPGRFSGLVLPVAVERVTLYRVYAKLEVNIILILVSAPPQCLHSLQRFSQM